MADTTAAPPVPAWHSVQLHSQDLKTTERLQSLNRFYDELRARLWTNFDPIIRVDELSAVGRARVSFAKFGEYLSSGHGTLTRKWSNQDCKACSKLWTTDREDIDIMALLRGHQQRKELLRRRDLTKQPYIVLSRADESQTITV